MQRELINTCKETLMLHEIPEGAWEKIAADLFTHHDKEYLVTVCYKSDFWELDRLIDIKSSTVIKKVEVSSGTLWYPISD